MHLTRLTGLATMAGAALALGCGEGRTIFNVDVYSFLKGTSGESVPYLAPSPLPDTTPVQQITLSPVTLDKSVVESVFVTGAVVFANQTGTGTVGLKLYIDTIAALYSDTPAVVVTPVTVTPGANSTSTFQADAPTLLQQFFLQSKVYVGMRAIATASVGPVTGQARLSALRVRIVVQDKFF